MRIRVVGAAGGEVTGSAYVVETGRARVLVDCGLFQGGRKAEAKNRAPIRAGARLDAAILTHGHLDHTGRLPLLARLGYRGPVFATSATIDMTGLILHDAAKIQVQDMERQNRRRRRRGEAPLEPLYTPEDAEAILGRMKEVPYSEPVPIAPGIRACLTEAGHMLGSASVQLRVEENGREKRVVFSGDLGPRGIPILRDFEPFHEADLVFLESTYGDRDHRPFRETVEQFVAIVKDAVDRRGKVLVPTFAVGRAQLLVTILSKIFRTKRIPPFPVFLDSPMAIEATRIYLDHPELYDDEMRAYLKEKPIREDLATLKPTPSPEESRRINSVPGPCMILAGAGMCNAGRILHHLKENLWREETHVLIVGYQAQESLGRRLVEGAKQVSILGEKIVARAKIHTLNGFSAHAGQTDLLEWFSVIARCRPRVVLTHGENAPRAALAREIRRRHNLKPALPALGEVIEA